MSHNKATIMFATSNTAKVARVPIGVQHIDLLLPKHKKPTVIDKVFAFEPKPLSAATFQATQLAHHCLTNSFTTNKTWGSSRAFRKHEGIIGTYVHIPKTGGSGWLCGMPKPLTTQCKLKEGMMVTIVYTCS
jgi:hypothetical protein